MEVILAQPRGFCAGVERAIEIVERAIKIYGTPIYVRHEIVHNKYVVDDLKSKGVIFVKELSEIPSDSVTIFSAHGVSQAVENEADKRNLNIIDATCPLVTKVHKEAQRNEKNGYQIVLIGHSGHPEVEGTSGRVEGKVLLIEKIEDVKNLRVKNPEELSYVTQTTLSVDDTKGIIDELKTYFPNIQGPGTKDICYATQNRQNAVRTLAQDCDLILVVGATNSSNSSRLRDLGEEMGVESYLIRSFEYIDKNWFSGKKKIGVTSGASAPELLVEQVIDFLKKNYQASVSIMDGEIENIKFKLPKKVLL